MDLAEGARRLASSRACSSKRRRELKVLERDITKLEAVQAPFPRISYDEAVEDRCKAKGLPFEWGGDFGGPDETALSRAVRPAGDGPPLSRRR